MTYEVVVELAALSFVFAEAMDDDVAASSRLVTVGEGDG